MKLSVAVDQRWGIGRDNDLLFSIPEDMRMFRQRTGGKIVVMGRATLQSLPGGAPLKNRVNIVLSRDEGFAAEGAVICHSLAQLGEALAEAGGEVWVIGGDSVYRQLLEYCDEAYVTKVYADGNADRFFPNIDEDESWVLKEQSEVKDHEGLRYRFCTYRNTKPKNL